MQTINMEKSKKKKNSHMIPIPKGTTVDTSMCSSKLFLAAASLKRRKEKNICPTYYI